MVHDAFHAVIFLHYGMMWVAVAGCLAFYVGRRFFGAVDGSPVLSAACSVIRNSLLVGLMFFPAAAMLVPFRGMWSVHKKDNKDPLTLVVIGGLVLVAFMMLIAAADFVVGQSPLKGSQTEQVDSVLTLEGPWAGAVGCRCSISFHHLTQYGSEAALDEVEWLFSCVVET